MISVLASESDEPVAREFFELFKTPWQFHVPGRRAEVLLCVGNEGAGEQADLKIVYVAAPRRSRERPLWFRNEELEFPVYGAGEASAWGDVFFQRGEQNGAACVWIGYDLFAEIRLLLSAGQPPALAAIPTLELHIALLRKLILEHGLALLEIPPSPADHDFIVCLTHDVDHPAIRNHKFDHTAAGFVYRATVGSLLDVARGLKTVRQMAENWLAALKLPLVHAGLAGDFWHEFDHYVALEKGRGSTFFVIPRKGETGLDHNGRRQARRAASYDARDLRDDLLALGKNGKEVGVHGIDAWRNAAAGGAEKKVIADLIGAPELGVRMHWLYFAAQSPLELENAGFTYDSTMGYNDTVGYRAGTAQVFKPLAAKQLLELPLHVMDTALFYPSYLHLSAAQADEILQPLIENAVAYGGVLTVNWHDRSLAPERLWGDAYARLLDRLQARNPWFATAAQCVGWFRRRRAARFETSPETGEVRIQMPEGSDALPPLRIRVFPARKGGRCVENALPAGGRNGSPAAPAVGETLMPT
ncbi:MAG TPA: hypothetical protein VF988_05515 [Verrucomicrobiae bacterium]